MSEEENARAVLVSFGDAARLTQEQVDIVATVINAVGHFREEMADLGVRVTVKVDLVMQMKKERQS